MPGSREAAGEDTVKALCSELGLIHCVDPFEAESLHGRPRYFRLHGGPRYQHRYDIQELQWLRDLVRDEEGYVLFNNIGMYQDAMAFMRLL